MLENNKATKAETEDPCCRISSTNENKLHKGKGAGEKEKNKPPANISPSGKIHRFIKHPLIILRRSWRQQYQKFDGIAAFFVPSNLQGTAGI